MAAGRGRDVEEVAEARRPLLSRSMQPPRRHQRRRRSAAVVAVLAVGVALLTLFTAGPASARPGTVRATPFRAVGHSSPATALTVRGNHLVNGAGKVTRLLGVDRSGTEYACEEAWGIFDGPSSAASVAAMATWHVNAVRLTLNEGCWLGLFTTANDAADGGHDPAPFEGTAYRHAISAYVALLHARGMVVILSLNSLDAPDGLGVPPMADAKHSPAFWSSVAATFRRDPAVVFDLYNEPHAISWSCWLHGCKVSTSAGSYEGAGMQSLVTAVRATGAAQPIMLGGLDYSSDETRWRSYLPTDPDKSLVVSFHTYNTTNCNTSACWTTTIEPLAKVVPVVTGEFGEYDCSTPYSTRYMAFADAHGISYLGWAWTRSAPAGGSATVPR